MEAALALTARDPASREPLPAGDALESVTIVEQPGPAEAGDGAAAKAAPKAAVEAVPEAPTEAAPESASRP